MSFDFCVPTRVVFGCGKFGEIENLELPGKKALIVISSGKSMHRLGYLEKLEQQLDKKGIGHCVFNKILPNPIKPHVMEGAALAREEGCDFIIALGGGSTIDSSKAISLMATNDGDYWDYVKTGTGKGMPIKNDPLPLMVISTTSGTGSEADSFAVITNEDTGEKIGFGCPLLFPKIALIDPELTASIPPALTAYQGFDVLFHCSEGCINRATSALGDLFAYEAISLVWQYLPRAVKDGSDMEAREKMALANLYAGYVQVLTNSTSAHAMEQAMSARHPDLAHGAGLIMIAEAYYAHFARKGVCNDALIRMAKVMGRPNAKTPFAFVSQLKKLMEACDVSELKMSEYGIEKRNLRSYVKVARASLPHMFRADPIETSDDECTNILRRSYK